MVASEKRGNHWTALLFYKEIASGFRVAPIQCGRQNDNNFPKTGFDHLILNIRVTHNALWTPIHMSVPCYLSAVVNHLDPAVEANGIRI